MNKEQSYYTNQLRQLGFEGTYRVKIFNDFGGSTHHISLNNNSIEVLINWLKKQYTDPTYIITKEDVGKTTISPRKICGVNEYPLEPLGKVLDIDIGKFCKKIKGIWYVENQQQYEKRMNNGKN